VSRSGLAPKIQQTQGPNKIFWRPKILMPSSEPVFNETQQIDSQLPNLDSLADFQLCTDASYSPADEQEHFIPQTHPLFTSATVENPSLAFSAHAAESDSDNDDSMANFQGDPRSFLVAGLAVEHGWNRPARGRMALGGEPTREHEDYAIVTINPPPQEAAQLRPTLNMVCDFLEHTQRVQVLESHLSPLGLGLIKLPTVPQRDQLVRASPFHMGQHNIVSVVKHDEGINSRSCNYSRVCWVMFLAFPLDFQKDVYIRAAVAPYGWLLEWYRDANKSRILVQVLLLSSDRVPRSLIVSRGTMLGGTGKSWAVPVYILNGNFPDAFPVDEDPVPIDGEQHPEHPPIVLGPHQNDPNWEEEQNGAANNLGVFGGNPHPDAIHHLNHGPGAFGFPGGDPNQEVDGQVEDMDEEDEDPWPEWNLTLPAAPEPHPLAPVQNLPQHFIDLDLSSSSMRFLRASGPDISLDAVLQSSSSEDSSSSSDATSLLDENQARFLAAQSMCATVLIFHKMGLPNLSSTLAACRPPPTLTLKPILIEPAVNAPSGLELVPWKPCIPAALLQYWLVVVEDLQRRASPSRASPAPTAAPILTGPSGINSGPSSVVVDSLPEDHVNLLTVPSINRPGPSTASAVVVETPIVQKKRAAIRASLPTRASNPTVPITATSVRRSARLNKQDGFCAVRLDREPAKKRKISIIQIDENTGKTEPVSLELLTSWGIDCGLTPSELTTDRLLQTPAQTTPSVDDEDTTEV
jgi:hypothetical protein